MVAISDDKLQILVNGLSNSSDLYSIASDNTSLLRLLAYRFYRCITILFCLPLSRVTFITIIHK